MQAILSEACFRARRREWKKCASSFKLRFNFKNQHSAPATSSIWTFSTRLALDNTRQSSWFIGMYVVHSCIPISNTPIMSLSIFMNVFNLLVSCLSWVGVSSSFLLSSNAFPPRFPMILQVCYHLKSRFLHSSSYQTSPHPHIPAQCYPLTHTH